MLSILFLSVLVTTTVALLCGMFYVMAVQAPVLAPTAGSSYTADTQVQSGTAAASDGWQSVTLNRLCDVEAFLDQLEAHNVTQREMVTLGDAAFLVRWK